MKARQWTTVGPMATPRQSHQVLDADPDPIFGQLITMQQPLVNAEACCHHSLGCEHGTTLLCAA